MSDSIMRFMSALESSNLDLKDEVVLSLQTVVKQDRIKLYERVLREILKGARLVKGHQSSCVVKPKPGEFKYITILKFNTLEELMKAPSMFSTYGIDLKKLIEIRDSCLSEPLIYQVERGSSCWIEDDNQMQSLDEADNESGVLFDIAKYDDRDGCDNPHGLMAQASFISAHGDAFQSQYQRNNKKGGQKNVRCFPNCKDGKHVTYGFCGGSVKVRVVIFRAIATGGVKFCPIQSTTSGISTYLRFVPLGDGKAEMDEFGPKVVKGQMVSIGVIEKYTKDRLHHLRPLITGVFRESTTEGSLQSAIFEFNGEGKAWHYGWSAPRGQGQSGGDVKHVLDVLVFKKVGTMFFCLEIIQSTPFKIFSSRRASNASASSSEESNKRKVIEPLNHILDAKRSNLGIPSTSVTNTTFPVSMNFSLTSDYEAYTLNSHTAPCINAPQVAINQTAPSSLFESITYSRLSNRQYNTSNISQNDILWSDFYSMYGYSSA